MEGNLKLIRSLKCRLFNLVVPNEKQHFTISANSQTENVEIFPDFVPVFLKVPLSQLFKPPCIFEIFMGDIDAICVYLSNEVKFPNE